MRRRPLFLWCLIAWLLCLYSPKANGFIDKTESVFFPPELAEGVRTFKSFPSFWWNFLVLEYKDEASGFVEARRICRRLKEQPLLDRIECEQDVTQYQTLVTDWAKDYPRRHPIPSPDALRASFDQTLARLSLPLPKSMFTLLRSDPLESYRDLQGIISKRLSLNLERVHGFFTDKDSKRIAIAIQPNFSPSENEKTDALLNAVFEADGETPGWGFLGPHASTVENRRQVDRDLATVSWIGVVITLFFCALLVSYRQTRLLLLLPPVALGALLSAVSVILIFGSIHGLALSFGGGIIGLTIDYGLHVAYNGNSRAIWRSNAIGFLTTMACLVVLMFSAIPLLKQLMVFSALGFGYSYLLLYFIQRKFPRLITAKPFSISLEGSRAKAAVVWVLLAGTVLGLFFIEPKLDPRQFDFQGPQTRALGAWFYGKTRNAIPLFQIAKISTDSPLETASGQLQWATEAGITVENVAQYLPSHAAQDAHLRSWAKVQCGPEPMASLLTQNQRTLFVPYLSAIRCETLSPYLLTDAEPRSYLRHLESNGSWLTLWLPNTAEETQRVKAKFPEAKSLLEVVSVFPVTLSRELKWMAPLSLFLVWLLLWWHFKSARLASVAMIPFFAGVGLPAWMSLLFGMRTSFISLIALVMLLGLSVDYAIFAVDYFLDSKEGDSHAGTATALIMSWVTTIVGFAPLAFCKHPVLADLGLTLTLGTIGTMAGAFWAVPTLVKQRKKVMA